MLRGSERRSRFKLSTLLCASTFALCAAGPALADPPEPICGGEYVEYQDDGSIVVNQDPNPRLLGEGVTYALNDAGARLQIRSGSRYRLIDTGLGTLRVELIEGAIDYHHDLFDTGTSGPPIQIVHNGIMIAGKSLYVGTEGHYSDDHPDMQDGVLVKSGGGDVLITLPGRDDMTLPAWNKAVIINTDTFNVQELTWKNWRLVPKESGDETPDSDTQDASDEAGSSQALLPFSTDEPAPGMGRQPGSSSSFNPFGDDVLWPRSSDECAAGAAGDQVSLEQHAQAIRDVPAEPAGDDDSIDLPAGPVGVSAGVGSRRENGGFNIGLEGAYVNYDFDPIGVGVRLGPGGEFFVAQTDDKFDEVGFGGRIGYAEPKFGGFSLYGNYFEDEGMAVGTVAPETDVTGNVNLDFNPNNGSTGILFGPAGLDARIDYDVDYLRIGGAWTPPDTLQGLPLGIEWAPTLEWTRFRQSHRTFAEPPAFGGDISDTREINVRNYYLDFDFEFSRALEVAFFGPVGALILRPYFLAGGTHYKVRFDAMESFVCALCGPDDNFDLEIAEEKDGLTWNADIGMKLEWPLSGAGKPGFSLYADARYEWMGGTSDVFIPRTGDDLFLDNRAAGLKDSDDASERFLATFGVRYSF